MKDINEVLEILKQFNPVSIFVYGSQSNHTANEKSDFELGVVFKSSKYINRDILWKSVNDENYSIFPFKLEDLYVCQIDTPFQKNIYLNSLVYGNAKTLYGKPVIEKLVPPKITKQDLLMDSSFNLGCALSSVRVFKSGDVNLANDMMYKSLFYTIRNLIYCETGEIVSGYNNIYLKLNKITIPDEYYDLVEIAYKLRNDNLKIIDQKFYFKNISFINKYAIPFIEKRCN